MMGFYADYLDLTDAQRAQMKDIMTKEKPTLKPLMQQLEQGHQQLRQLESAGTFDEAKVRTVATQQAQTMTELTVQKAASVGIDAGSDPDQRTRWPSSKRAVRPVSRSTSSRPGQAPSDGERSCGDCSEPVSLLSAQAGRGTLPARPLFL